MLGKQLDFCRELGEGGYGKVSCYKSREESESIPAVSYAVKEFNIRKSETLALFWNEWIVTSNLTLYYLAKSVAIQVEPGLSQKVVEILNSFVSLNDPDQSWCELLSAKLLLWTLQHKVMQEQPVKARIFLEYFDGKDLKLLDPLVLRDFDVFLNIVAQTILAVRELHENGVIHNDIKPANFLYRASDGLLKLCDCGGVELTNHRLFISNYTEEFAPPELRQHQARTYKSDIYSLGRTILYLAFKASENTVSPKVSKAGKVWSDWLRKLQKPWDGVREIVHLMTDSRAKHRITLDEALQLPIFKTVDFDRLKRLARQDAHAVATRYGLPFAEVYGSALLNQKYAKHQKEYSLCNSLNLYCCSEPDSEELLL